jgi:hypothetical protein
MSNWQPHLRPLLIVGVLFWSAVLTTGWSFIVDPCLHKILRAHSKFLIAIIVVIALWRVPLDGVFFHGLEYEDSYIYSVVARQMYERTYPPDIPLQTPYSIQTCEIGSLTSCRAWEVFPEHFPGYPFVIALFARMVGYTPAIGCLINLFGACVAGVLIFGTVLRTTEDVVMARASAFIFAITPVFGVYGLATSAEPFSNLWVTLVVWNFIRYVQALETPELETKALRYWGAYTATMLFAMTIKRENLLLAIVLGTITPFVLRGREATGPRQWRDNIPPISTALLGLLLSAHMHLVQTASHEGAMLKTFPFTPARLWTLAAGFLQSFFVMKWYGGIVFAVMLGMLVSWRRKGLSLAPLFLFAGYLALYAIHIRSFYDMRSGHVEPFEALRFSMNLMSLWSILGGIGIGAAIELSHSFWPRQLFVRPPTGLLWIAGTVVLGVSFTITTNLHSEAIEDEGIARLTPARSVLSMASHDVTNNVIVSMEPLVIQMYGDPAIRIIDLELITPDELKASLTGSRVDTLLWLKENNYETDADRERYGNQFAYLNSLPTHALVTAKDFSVIRVGPP